MNRKIRIVVVDDEMLARKALKAMLEDDPETELIAECRNGMEAVEAIRGQSPDIVFLDIQMPEMDGFEVIEEIGAAAMPVTVFVTAFDQYALRAFDAHALDYLLKPFDHERFYAALQRAKALIRQQKLSEISENLFALLEETKSKNGESTPETHFKSSPGAAQPEPLDRVVIKSGGRIYFLKTEEIDWVEGAGDYLSLHSGTKTHLVRAKMGDFHARLDSKKFLRIHRSTIVNIDCIKDLQPLFKGEYVVTLKSGKQLKASRGYRQALQPLLNEAR